MTSTKRKLPKELLRPIASEDFLELEMPIFGSGVGLEHINGLTEKVFETTTKSRPVSVVFPEEQSDGVLSSATSAQTPSQSACRGLGCAS